MNLDTKSSLLLGALEPATPPAVRNRLAKLVRTTQNLAEQERQIHEGTHLHRFQSR